MSVLHMETEEVREVACRMDEWARILWSRGEDLQSTSALLSQAWQSDEADRFLQQFNSWLECYRVQVEQLQSLACRLSRKVAEWEEAAASLVQIRFDWVKAIAGFAESPLKLLKSIPYDSTLRVDYRDIGRLLNTLVGNQKAGFVDFMDRVGHLVKTPVVQYGVPLALGIWADYQDHHDWKHAIGSEVIEFGIDIGLMAIPYVGQAYMVYKGVLAVGHLLSVGLELGGHQEVAVRLQNSLERIDLPERVGDAIYDFIAHPPKACLDVNFVARSEARFACGF